MSSAAADLALPDRRRVTAFSYKLPSPHSTQPSRLGATPDGLSRRIVARLAQH